MRLKCDAIIAFDDMMERRPDMGRLHDDGHIIRKHKSTS